MTTRAIDPIVQRLRALAEASPDLKEATEFYEAILPLLRDADLSAAPLSMTSEEAYDKIEAGRPLLDAVDLELDTPAVRDLMIELARALEGLGDKETVQEGDGLRSLSLAAGRLRLALQEGLLDVSGLMTHVAAGEEGMAGSIAEGLGLEPGVVWTMAQNALKPALKAWRLQLAPLAEGIDWHRGVCFLCGSAATLGELQGNNLTKHLRCGPCGADWQFRRLLCPWCGNEDHRMLTHLYAEGQDETRRIEVCDRCKGYLKVITSFTPTPWEMLPVEDLATLHLDYIARERGYRRAPLQ